MKEEIVSGNIFAKPDSSCLENESYVIRCPVTRHGWGIPTQNINPDDLRALADRIEGARAKSPTFTRIER